MRQKEFIKIATQGPRALYVRASVRKRVRIFRHDPPWWANGKARFYSDDLFFSYEYDWWAIWRV